MATYLKLDVIVVMNLKRMVEEIVDFIIRHIIDIEPQVVTVNNSDKNKCCRNATVKHPYLLFGPGEKNSWPKQRTILKDSKTTETDKLRKVVSFFVNLLAETNCHIINKVSVPMMMETTFVTLS